MKPIIIEYSSNEYPERLRKIQNPPSRLYALGNIKLLDEIGIAVVGSRTNTQYGEKMCKRFVKKLIEYNINIISGLAYGIDSIAHKKCLENFGKTIAVLPSGLENICRLTNKEIFDEILQHKGLIISEYENNVSADSKKFLERNRIVAGLGLGTLVVEAGYRSGTSVTARFTVENGNSLFCIPSSLENIKGKTTNLLIQQGAKLVISAEDIITELSRTNPNIRFIKMENKSAKNFLNVEPELQKVFQIINDEPKDINQIARRTRIPVSEANYKIMMLQLDNKIIELPGQRYIRNEGED